MNVINYFDSGRREHWFGELTRCDWRAGVFLCELLTDGRFFDTLGEGSKLLLLTDGDELISFCTYSKYDCIPDADLSPWIGFVYTFPEHRRRRYLGLLFDEAKRIAEEEKTSIIYIATDHSGVYERYGFEYKTLMKDIDGNLTRVYQKRIERIRL